jgi:DNA-binding transcriptional MerR regulator
VGYRVHAGEVRTGEVATQAPVNIQTLRYYERRGLLPEPQRTSSGYRAYSPDAVRVVRFVKRAQQLGFALDDIEDLLHRADRLSVAPSSFHPSAARAPRPLPGSKQRSNAGTGSSNRTSLSQKAFAIR